MVKMRMCYEIGFYQVFVDVSGVCVRRGMRDLEPGERSGREGVWERGPIALPETRRLSPLQDRFDSAEMNAGVDSNQ
jgi:hypothetical protein